jgi:hypothetical protein
MRRWLIWAAAAAALGASIIFLARLGLAKADTVASVVAMFVGIFGLAFSVHTVTQARTSRDVSPIPQAQPVLPVPQVTGETGPTAATEREGVEAPAAPEPATPTPPSPVFPAPEPAHPVDHPQPSAPVTWADAPPAAASHRVAPPSRGRHPDQAGTARLLAGRRGDNGEWRPAEPVSEELPLLPTPGDPTFTHAADATCALCGAAYRMGIRKKELLPRPGPGNWAAAVFFGILTAGMAVFQIWLIPPLVRYGFVEAPADTWFAEAFNRTFALVCALGGILMVLVLARWTRSHLRVDATYTELLAGPEDPGHAHVGRISSTYR